MALEEIFINNVPNYICFANQYMGIDCPYTLEVGAIGLEDSYPDVIRCKNDKKRTQYGPICTDELFLRRKLEEATDAGIDDEIKEFLLEFFKGLFDRARVKRPEGLITDTALKEISLQKTKDMMRI